MLQPSWLSTAQEQIEQQEYQPSLSQGAWQAPNRSQGFRSVFEKDGVRFLTRDLASRTLAKIALTGVGRGPAPPSIGAAKLVAEDDGQISMRWDNLLLRSNNGPEGLSQALQISQKPAGSGPLIVAVDVGDGGDEPEVRADAIFISGLRLGEFTATDQAGQSLAVSLSAQANGFNVEIGDKDASYPITLKSVANGTADAVLESGQVLAQLGWSVAGAGDINNDGFDDIIVGARLFDNGQMDEGAAFIYFGGSGAFNTVADALVQSNQASAQFGWSVAGAGDVNNDGFDDVIVGAFGFANGQAFEGAAFIYFGGSGGFDATADAQLESNQANASFGSSVASAGDVNNDGFDDVIIGAYLFDNGQVDEGAAFIYFGGAGTFNTTADAVLDSNQASAWAGLSVAGAGDVNGDNFDDVIIGALNYTNGQVNEGGAFIYFGGTGAFDPTVDAILEQNQASAGFGISVAGAGNVNGDGFDDVIVGAYLFDNGQTDEGAAFVYFGGSGAFNTTSDATLEPNQANAQMNAVAGAGDVNSDGFDDVIVGAFLFDNGQVDEGAAFVYYGGSGAFNTTADAQLESNLAGTQAGYSVAGAGDVNGDGAADVISGAYAYTNGQNQEGAAYLYLGTPGNQPPSFVAGPNQLQAAGTNTLQTVVGWATSIDDGNSGVVQTLTFNVSNNNNGLFTSQPQVAANGTLTYTPTGAPGVATVSVSLTDDATAGGPPITSGTQTFTITINPPSVAIAVAPANVAEDGASNLVYTVTRSANLASSTVVNINTSGTATAGNDYTGGVSSVTIPSGATTATITINPTADTVVEADETVTLTVATGSGYSVGAPSSATGTILNDDVPAAAITVAPASVSEDGAANLLYTVTLSQAAFSPTSLNFNIGGTAANGTDYAAITSPLLIPTGNTTGTITVNPTADTTIEPDETVIISLAAGTGYTVASPNSATGTILNDDLPNLSINDVSIDEGNSSTSILTFTVTRTGTTASAVGFNFATVDGTATTADSDYVAISGTGTIAAGGATGTTTINVTINGDAIFENTESFFVNLSAPSNAVISDDQGIGTITNDDIAPTLAINAVSIDEGNSGTQNLVFTVTRTGLTALPASFTAATANGTAVAPSDYLAALSGSTSIAAGGATGTTTLSATINGDTDVEPNETFFVNLSAPVNATIAANQGIGTITNDDVAPPTVNTINPASGSIAGGTSVTITGTDFSNATAVSIGGVAATGVTVVGPTSITATTGANAAGPASVNVTTPAGTNAPNTLYTYTCLATPVAVVTNGNDSGAGSLRQIIAEACPGSTITFAPAVSTVTLTTAELLINKNLTIDGGVPGVTVTRSTAPGTPDFRLINITAGGNTTLSKLTVSNGRAFGFGAESFGAGIEANSANLTLNDCVVRDNRADLGGGQGGGVSLGFGTLTMNRTLVENNTAVFAPGVYVFGGFATITDSTIRNNSGTVSGGGLRMHAGAGTLQIVNSTIANNTGSTELGETAIGLVGTTVTATLINSTIVNNSSAGAGSAAIFASGGTNNSVTLINTIVSGNLAAGVPADSLVNFEAASANSLIGTGGGLTNGVNGNIVGVNNPLVSAFGNYGGPTPTLALLPGSPAINAGTATDAPTADQRGIARPQLGTVDIGAFESRGFFVQIDDLAGDGQRVAPGQMFPIPLTVSVVPLGAGEPVSGGSVSFTSIGAGAGATFLPNPASIDANGIASSIATANATVGSYSVLASIDGGAGVPALFLLTNAAAELSLSDAAIVTEGDAATSNAVFIVTRSNNLTAFSVPYSVNALTAQAGTDYTATSGTLSFAAGGALTQTISVPVIGDLIVEDVETATLDLGAVTDSAGVTTITDGSGLLTITDNDSAVVAFSPVSVSQSEAITPMAFTVTLSNPVQSGVTLALNSAFGTATAADFTPITGGTVSFPANDSTSQTVNVVINNDALDENDESFTLTLSALTAVGNVTSGALVATGTIIDDDLPPEISITSPSLAEGDGGNTPMEFVVLLSTPSGRDVTFTRATADDSAMLADNDYVQLPPLGVSITAGDIGAAITVQIVGDTTFEGDESFSLILSNIVNATVALPPLVEGTPTSITGTGTIEEDDQQPTTTTIMSDMPDPSLVGQPYTVVVDVVAISSSPLGTVTVSDGTDSCGPVTLLAGTSPTSSASCLLTSTTSGAKTLTATYAAASSAFATSTDTEAHQVNPASTTISVSGPPRSRINTPTAFSLALAVSAPGGGTPTGTVTLSSGGSSCQVSVPAASSSCDLSFDLLGPRTVSASFASTDGNHLGADSSGAGDLQTLVFAQSDLAVTKTDTVSSYAEGDLLVYTITLRNLGADAAENLRLLDTVPAGLIDVQWTCDSSGGAVCPADNGSGDLDAQIASYPVGALLNYSFYGNVSGQPEQILNVAEVQLPDDETIEDGNLDNNSASDLNLRDLLFADGFEAVTVTAAAGSYRLPSAALQQVLDGTAIAVFVLDDANGQAARIYARVFDGQLQYALAQRGSNGLLRLGSWTSYSGEPLLSWSATENVRGWVVQAMSLD